jgi:hypothetical protein
VRVPQGMKRRLLDAGFAKPAYHCLRNEIGHMVIPVGLGEDQSSILVGPGECLPKFLLAARAETAMPQSQSMEVNRCAASPF